MKALYHSLERELFGVEPRPIIPLKRGTDDTRALAPANSPTKDITSRLATALIAAAQAQKVPLQEGSLVKRVFSYNGSTWVIENGCGQDLIRAGAAELVGGLRPRDDQFRLTSRLLAWIASRATTQAWRAAQDRVRHGQA